MSNSPLVCFLLSLKTELQNEGCLPVADSNTIYLSVFRNIDDLLAKGEVPVVVAIDGRSGSGKSTLAKNLHDFFSCPIVSLDHFFLQSAQRSVERLQEVGGNIDYERFQLEVGTQLRSGQGFSYQVYDCQQDRLTVTVEIRPYRLIVVEGCYSHHPIFAEHIDLRVFLTVESETQQERILQRNGSIMLERFLKEWIPLEERYFSGYDIMAESDLVIATDSLPT